MKKMAITMLLMFSIMLVACDKKESAINDSKKFVEDFILITKEYRDNPTKENLDEILNLVKNTDIRLNEEEKNILRNEINNISQKVEISNEDIKILWENNKDNIFSKVKEQTKLLIEKGRKWLNDTGK